MLRSTVVLVSPLLGVTQVRTMATLKDISMRLKSVKNIQKITKSMKMVSAAKFTRAEKELKSARPYGAGARTFYERAELEQDPSKPNHLIVALTSDRGLCGGVHSAIIKAVKAEIASKGPDVNTKVVCVGDKSKAILGKLMKENILFAVNEVGRQSAKFSDASEIAQAIINSGYNFDHGSLYYNKFKSVISYEPTALPLFSLDAITKSKKISVYDSLDSFVLESYTEYALASLIYFALKEAALSEQSARMTAMDGAAKNAGEMIDRLTLTYNRTRQSVITRELIEIISGAAALE